MQREQWSNDHPIPFKVVQNVDDLPGAGGVVPTVKLSKDGGPFASAHGIVSAIGSGWFALLPDQRDRDTLGTVAVEITVPAGYIAVPLVDTYEVVPRISPLANRTEAGYLSDIAAYLKAIANYTLPTQLRF